MTDSMTSSMLQLSLDNKNKIPKFYFPDGNELPEMVELEEKIMSQVFNNGNYYRNYSK